MDEDTVSLVDVDPPDRYRFDYKGMHRYYITLPVYAAKKVFTEQARIVGVMNVLRDCAMNHVFDVYAYSFLPDQLVLIVRGKSDTSNMKEFLTDFRTKSSVLLEKELGHTLWKKKYLERVLRKTEDSKQMAESIFRLPVKAGLAATPEKYPFQGSFVIIPKPKRYNERH